MEEYKHCISLLFSFLLQQLADYEACCAPEFALRSIAAAHCKGALDFNGAHEPAAVFPKRRCQV